MTFEEMLERPAIACGTVDDGYNGARRAVIWRYDRASGKVLRQWRYGFHVDAVPPAADIAEAVYLLETHPNARGYRLRRARPQRCGYCGEADRNAGQHGPGICGERDAVEILASHGRTGRELIADENRPGYGPDGYPSPDGMGPQRRYPSPDGMGPQRRDDVGDEPDPIDDDPAFYSQEFIEGLTDPSTRADDVGDEPTVDDGPAGWQWRHGGIYSATGAGPFDPADVIAWTEPGSRAAVRGWLAVLEGPPPNFPFD